MVPLDDEDPVKTTKSVLESRYDFDEIFNEITEGEVINKIVYYFSDVPALVERALGRRVPNITALLKKASGTSSTVTSYDDGEDDDVPEPSFRKAKRKAAPVEESEEEEEGTKESSRSFEPSDDDLPPPVSRKKADSLDDDKDEEEAVVETIPQRKKAGVTPKTNLDDLLD